MQTKSDRVRTAIGLVHEWYSHLDRDIRTLSERIEQLWFEIDDQLTLMEEAEKEANADAATAALERIIHHITAIQADAKAVAGGYYDYNYVDTINLPLPEKKTVTSTETTETIVQHLLAQGLRMEDIIMPGSAKDMDIYVADDFDAPLDEFEDYI